MRLHELLKSVDIDKVLPIIVEYYYKDKSNIEKVEYNFKRSYNELINTEVEYYPSEYVDSPGENSREIWIEDEDGDSDIPYARWIEGELKGSLALGKEIVLKCRKMLSNEELVAICLWHITFYGFTDEERMNYINSLASELY
jgi:hypothetical protein